MDQYVDEKVLVHIHSFIHVTLFYLLQTSLLEVKMNVKVKT